MELTTKRDIEELRIAMKNEIKDVRNEIKELKVELKNDINDLRKDMDIKLKGQEIRLIKWMFAMFIAFGGAQAGLVAFVVKMSLKGVVITSGVA